jgi:hypothetical protein
MTAYKIPEKSKSKKIAAIFAAIVIVILALFFFRSQSSQKITINPVGTTADVYINETKKSSLPATRAKTYRISESDSQVLVASPNHYPWTETVSLQPGEEVTLTPFLLARTPETTQDIPDNITADLKTSPSVPTSTGVLVSEAGNTTVFVDPENQSNIIAQWTDEPASAPDFYDCFEGTCGVSVYNNQPVRQLAFYPGRSDVIIFATDSAVYALEIDPSGTQNAQIVAENITNPVFAIEKKNKRIFVTSPESQPVITKEL